ncbi:hypothetical protein WJX77_001153 [Trebouxia sp. C0004]
MSSSAPAVSVALWIVKDSLQLGCFQLRLSMKLEGDHKRLLHSTECSLNSLWVLGFSQAELLHQPSAQMLHWSSASKGLAVEHHLAGSMASQPQANAVIITAAKLKHGLWCSA